MRDPFMDEFDDEIDRYFDRMDSVMNSKPVFAVGGMFLLVLLINLLFWGALIFGTLWGLNHYGVI